MYNVKYDPYELIYKAEIDTYRENTSDCRFGGQGGMDWEFEISRYKLL